MSLDCTHMYEEGETVLAWHGGEWKWATYQREDVYWYYVVLQDGDEEVKVTALRWGHYNA